MPPETPNTDRRTGPRDRRTPTLPTPETVKAWIEEHPEEAPRLAYTLATEIRAWIVANPERAKAVALAHGVHPVIVDLIASSPDPLTGRVRS